MRTRVSAAVLAVVAFGCTAETAPVSDLGGTTADTSPSETAAPSPTATLGWQGTSTCTGDPTGDPEDGNYQRDVGGPAGLDLLGAAVEASDDEVTFTWQMAGTPPTSYDVTDDLGDPAHAFWAIDIWAGPDDHVARVGLDLVGEQLTGQLDVLDLDAPTSTTLAGDVARDGNQLSYTVPSTALPAALPEGATWNAALEYGPYPEYVDHCPDAAEDDLLSGPVLGGRDVAGPGGSTTVTPSASDPDPTPASGFVPPERVRFVQLLSCGQAPATSTDSLGAKWQVHYVLEVVGGNDYHLVSLQPEDASNSATGPGEHEWVWQAYASSTTTVTLPGHLFVEPSDQSNDQFVTVPVGQQATFTYDADTGTCS